MKIYLVTNRNITKGNYLNQIENACIAGINKIILREKDLKLEDYLKLAIEVKKITDKYKVPLILNGNIQVAKEIEAYAYHSSYKEFINSKKLYSKVGVSIHSLEEGINAEKLGADYILAGHIFETDCKKDLEPRGINFLKSLRENIEIPIVAIGGINPKNIGDIYKTEVNGFAVMSYIMSSDDSLLATEKLKNSLDKAIGR